MTNYTYKGNKKLRKFRESLDISQDDMAAACKMSSQALCAIELGHERLGVVRAMRLYEAYGKQLIAAGISFESLIREQR